MKLERRFWTDATDELIRPVIDLKAIVSSSGGNLAGTFDTNWYETQASLSPQAVNLQAYAYANMLNGNGFRLGDPRCVLTEENSPSIPFASSPSAATVSYASNNTATLMCVSAVRVYMGYQYNQSIRLWNVKDLTLTVEAVDNVSLTANVLDTATVTVALDDYAEEYLVEINVLDLFPGWDDSTYHGIRISYTIPSGDRLFYAGYLYSYSYLYLPFGIQDIVNINYDEGLELISGEVPHQTLELTVYDEAGNFDPTNPNGYYDKITTGLVATVYVGVEGAYLSPVILNSTGDVKYNRHQLTMEFDTPWQAKSATSYASAAYIGNVGDDLQQYSVWSGSINNSLNGYKTNAVTADPQWTGELDQLKLSSVGAFAFYNETYSLLRERLGCKATELQNLDAQDYHVRARDIKDTFATLERKAMLGDIKVTKYRYYISNESKTVSASQAERFALSSIAVSLPEWCRHGARFDMSTLSAVDENGNTVSQANLNWIVQESSAFGVRVIVAHSDNTTKLVSASLSGTIHYWAQEVLSVTTETVNSGGEECAIDNPFVTTDAQVKAIIDSVKYIYGQRDVFTAQWAQDWRVELGDIIYLDTQFETDVKCVVTGLKFSYPGLWGEITMRRLE